MQTIIVILGLLLHQPQPVPPGAMIEAPDGQIHATFASIPKQKEE